MGTPFRTRSKTGPTGVKSTTTQKQGGGVKTTTSHKTGSSSRVAFTRSSNGSVVQTTTQKLGNGYMNLPHQPSRFGPGCLEGVSVSSGLRR